MTVSEKQKVSELKLLEEAGEISHLELQPVVVLQDKFIRARRSERSHTEGILLTLIVE
ncbi:MAG: hypothetical protein ACLVI9_00805 [Anaerostipes hadrus]